MNKKHVAVAILVAASNALWAQVVPTDTLTTIHLQEVQVVSTRATAQTPVAFTNLSKEQIRRQNVGPDLPFLLTTTPSVLVTSDAGTGIGYTSLRIRGTDATRINVTTNGIPMNDAESNILFWVNTPDLASSLEDIQVQRGAGTSTNGAGAFGASINMQTQGIPSRAYAEFAGSYGSFNTQKQTLRVGTGLLGEHWAFDARLSNISSDGYRDRASAQMQAYHLQAGYYGANTSLKFITFSGTEQTYHAWDGISREQLANDPTYNPNGVIKDDNQNQGNEIGFYKDQLDNYQQTHYQLLADHRFASTLTLNLALHYTHGNGYYQEYKNGRTLLHYGLQPYRLAAPLAPDALPSAAPHEPTLITQSNLVRQKLVRSHFGGGVFSLNYTDGPWKASIGGGANHYTNQHRGKVIWVKNYTHPLDPDHEYYRNRGTKLDANLYAKAHYQLTPSLSAYADLQYRMTRYQIDGDHDTWDWTATPERLQTLHIDAPFHFLNPKAGLHWQLTKHHAAYASVAVAQKEPTRNNYTDGDPNRPPRPEKMLDYEAGYTYQHARFTAGVNLYYMDYTDQLVLNGRLNQIGEPLAENVSRSYRMGVELSLGMRLTPWLRWDVNGTLSRNRINDYTAYLSDYSDQWEELYTQTAIEVGSTPIAFSPTGSAGSLLALSHRGFDLSVQSQYASRQYLDNLGTRQNSLDPYLVHHLNAAYTFKLPHVKQVTLGATVYNLLNERYQTNGYSQTAALYADGDKSHTPTLTHDPRFYPMAGINVLAHLTLRF